MPDTRTLLVSGSVTLDGTGSGVVRLGPQSTPGTSSWRVDGVILQTSRPGVAPIPRAVVYLDQQDPSGTQGLTYDGSFTQGACDLLVPNGSLIIVAWTGGQSGDRASVTLTGTRL